MTSSLSVNWLIFLDLAQLIKTKKIKKVMQQIKTDIRNTSLSNISAGEVSVIQQVHHSVTFNINILLDS